MTDQRQLTRLEEAPAIDVIDEGVLPVPVRPSALRRAMAICAGPLVVLAVVVGVWYFMSYVVLAPSRRFLLPPLQTTVNTAFLQGGNLSELLHALGVTAEVAMTGLAVAIGLGVTIAIAMSEAKSVERGLYPYLVLLQTMPILAVVPLIGFWLGYGFMSRTIVCVLIAIFPIIANTLFGLQSPSAAYGELFDLHHANRLTKLVKLKLPMALPAMFAGFRISAGLSVIGEIVGGYFFEQGAQDLGSELSDFIDRLDTPMLFGAIICSAALGVAVFWLFTALSAAVVGRWKE